MEQKENRNDEKKEKYKIVSTDKDFYIIDLECEKKKNRNIKEKNKE